MLEMQKPPKDKHGIGYTDDIASTSNMKKKKLGPKNSKMPSIEPALLVPSAREPASSNEQNWLSAAKMENVRLKVKLEPDEWIKDSGYSRHMTGNKDLFSSYKTIDGGAIDLSKNPVLHSRTKHIEIRHHFLHDNVQKGNISIEKVSSEDNIADILTKPLKRENFNLLRLGLGLMEPNT
ncbi:hypothetical protein Tco_0304497 [Tanacetum coccineum]